MSLLVSTSASSYRDLASVITEVLKTQIPQAGEIGRLLGYFSTNPKAQYQGRRLHNPRSASRRVHQFKQAEKGRQIFLASLPFVLSMPSVD